MMNMNNMTDKHQPESSPSADDNPVVTPERGINPDAQTTQPAAQILAEELTELTLKLQESQRQSEEFKASWMRSVADLENFRRRVVREKEDLRKFALSSLIEALLPVLDNLMLGLDSARTHHPEANAVIEGVDMVQTQLLNVLSEHGVERIQPKAGAVFDPNFQECVAHLPSDTIPEGAVMALHRVGFKLNDRLMRPASVVVSSGVSQTEQTEG
jgi:molecular chaperone GrpE